MTQCRVQTWNQRVMPRCDCGETHSSSPRNLMLGSQKRSSGRSLPIGQVFRAVRRGMNGLRMPIVWAMEHGRVVLRLASCGLFLLGSGP